jgi:transposase-like protein
VARLLWKKEWRILPVNWGWLTQSRPPGKAATGGMRHGRAYQERCAHDGRPGSLGELIHVAVRHAIEVAVDEELTAALGARPYQRGGDRGGYRNGTKPRTLTGPAGPLALTVPRARLFSPAGPREWASTLLPRYQRRLREVNEAVVATYLAGANTRRLRGALGPLLRAAPLSKSAVSRVVGTLKAELEAWRIRSLAELDVLGLYLAARRPRATRGRPPCAAPGARR